MWKIEFLQMKLRRSQTSTVFSISLPAIDRNVSDSERKRHIYFILHLHETSLK